MNNRMTVDEIPSILTEYPTVIIPAGTDGLMNHAICVVDDLIFDSMQWCTLSCKVESITWICDSGKQGVASVYEAFRFQNPISCKPLERKVKH
jgi:hypothetical protein